MQHGRVLGNRPAEVRRGAPEASTRVKNRLACTPVSRTPQEQEGPEGKRRETQILRRRTEVGKTTEEGLRALLGVRKSPLYL